MADEARLPSPLAGHEILEDLKPLATVALSADSASNCACDWLSVRGLTRAGAFEQAAFEHFEAVRNPLGHRNVECDDATEAAATVLFADLLMRQFDRVEGRLAVTTDE